MAYYKFLDYTMLLTCVLARYMHPRLPAEFVIFHAVQVDLRQVSLYGLNPCNFSQVIKVPQCVASMPDKKS